MGKVCHTDRVRAGFCKGTYLFMHPAHHLPCNGAFHRVDDNAVVLQRFPQIGVGKAAFFPFVRGIAGEVQSAVGFADFFYDAEEV